MILRVHRTRLRLSASVSGFAALLALPGAGGAQNLGTLGTGIAGETTAACPGGVPTGAAPRLPNGHIDFSGVWDHAYVPDMSLSNNRTPALQKGAGELPYSPIAYTVTIDDPVYYTKPWINERTFTLSNGELLEYSCEENNKSLWEGRIKLWLPPGTSQPREKNP